MSKKHYFSSFFLENQDLGMPFGLKLSELNALSNGVSPVARSWVFPEISKSKVSTHESGLFWCCSSPDIEIQTPPFAWEHLHLILLISILILWHFIGARRIFRGLFFFIYVLCSGLRWWCLALSNDIFLFPSNYEKMRRHTRTSIARSLVFPEKNRLLCHKNTISHRTFLDLEIWGCGLARNS